MLIVNGCPAVVRCTLPASNPSNNGAMLTELERIETAWAECANQVDMIYRYQQGVGA